ncbi:MAG TPA: aminopeptidase [Candidatus Krumholzibacteriaceae bacterium]|nr:aminopeptidase [Candidatus Krumholzibacteriaceae bacterium]
MNKLYKAAKKTIYDGLKLKRGESLLLVTDRKKMRIAEAIAHWGKKKNAEVTTYLMTETLRPIARPTAIFKSMMRKADATIYMLDARVEEKPFRAYMVENGAKKGRIIMMPGITSNMMERLVNIDYKKLNTLTRKVIRKLKDSTQVHVTNHLGTDITFSVKGRSWENDNGRISKMGEHGNLPAGECYTCPVEKTFTGKIVISLIDDKKGKGTMVFEKGKLVDYKGRGVREIVKTIGKDPSGYIIGEFGIGTNRGAKICRNMLEAEKAFGTVHFAIGDSYGLGKNKSKWHFDGLVEKATLSAGRKEIIRKGKFLVK